MADGLQGNEIVTAAHPNPYRVPKTFSCILEPYLARRITVPTPSDALELDVLRYGIALYEYPEDKPVEERRREFLASYPATAPGRAG